MHLLVNTSDLECMGSIKGYYDVQPVVVYPIYTSCGLDRYLSPYKCHRKPQNWTHISVWFLDLYFIADWSKSWDVKGMCDLCMICRGQLSWEGLHTWRTLCQLPLGDLSSSPCKEWSQLLVIQLLDINKQIKYIY